MKLLGARGDMTFRTCLFNHGQSNQVHKRKSPQAGSRNVEKGPLRGFGRLCDGIHLSRRDPSGRTSDGSRPHDRKLRVLRVPAVSKSHQRECEKIVQLLSHYPISLTTSANKTTHRTMTWTLKLCAIVAMLTTFTPAKAEEFVSPDILILGDSQISFGSGPSFLKFFSDIKHQCHPTPKQEKYLKHLGEMKVGVIGVRSTSIHSWTARKGRAKGRVCDVDPKWKVNAGSYGYLNQTGNKYVQIGKGDQYQFCAPNKSPFEVMFREDYYDPKLLLLSFLGNSSKRWAESKEKAAADVDMLTKQLPPDLPCIFMTTAPAFSKKIVDRRLKAQKNIMEAFAEKGHRCTFVEGATPKTVKANQGNKHYFRLNKRGRVKDPYHPNAKAAENFFALEMEQICGAIFEQISMIMEKPET